MYGAPATSTSALNGLIGSLVAGGLAYLAFVLIITAITILVWYAVIKSAVREGTYQALKKAGLADSGLRLQGYPAEQNYGAPPAPAYESRGYGDRGV